MIKIEHHGAINGVTGSCHELWINEHESVLVDCGLFQGVEPVGAEGDSKLRSSLATGVAGVLESAREKGGFPLRTSCYAGQVSSKVSEPKRAKNGYAAKASEKVVCSNQQPPTNNQQLAGEIEFPIRQVKALVVTHAHIDHVGRIPYLLAAGFNGPIYCSKPTAILLPIVLEDALKIGFTRNRRLIDSCLKKIKDLIVAIDYGVWETLPVEQDGCRFKLKTAGHILGSAYIEFAVESPRSNGGFAASRDKRIVFSGDLGAPYTPLLPAPKSPFKADVLVLESTYGDRKHENRRLRAEKLKKVIEYAVKDKGAVLIPAFSIGRTQELLYELESIIHRYKNEFMAKGLEWDDIEIIVDSPMAAKFTKQYKELKAYWDSEAKRIVDSGRHPLSFEQLWTVEDHQDHLNTVKYIKKTARPCVVIAASGMCTGGRIMNYLKALVEDKRTDVLFVGYQASGTPGRTIQNYGPKNGYVELEGKRYNINARVHTISGYSAHADSENLVNFVKRIRHKPKEIRLVHGEFEAKNGLRKRLIDSGYAGEIII